MKSLPYRLFFVDEDRGRYIDLRREMNLYIRFFVRMNAINEIYKFDGFDFEMLHVLDLRRVVFDYWFTDFSNWLETADPSADIERVFKHSL